MRKPFLIKSLSLFIVTFLTISLSAQVRYVKEGYRATTDGLSWSTAYSNLQDALDDVMAGSADEIKIYEGTYYPKESPDGSTDYKKYAFHLDSDCEIKGGYRKITRRFRPPVYSQRGISILTGDLTFTESGDSAYHVFITYGLTEETEITRIKITGGKADGNDTTFFASQNYYSQFGAGMYNIESDPILTFHNSGPWYAPDFEFVRIEDNKSTGNAAGMFNKKSDPTLNSVLFKGNTADRDGGGLYNKDRSEPEINFCRFIDNSAGNYGGAIMNNNNSKPTIKKTLFKENSATKRGGAIYNWSSCDAYLESNAFEGNESGQIGGAIASYQSSPTITNAVFTENKAEYGSAIAAMYQCGSVITNATFFANEATVSNGGAIYVVSGWPTINNTVFYDNIKGDVRNVGGLLFGTHNASDYGTSSGANLGSGFVNLTSWDGDEVFRDPLNPDGFPPSGYFGALAGLTPHPCGPLVDAGNNGKVPSGVTSEMRNLFLIYPLPRIVGDNVDIGAYEMNIENDAELPSSAGIHTSTDVIEQGGTSYFVDCGNNELILGVDLAASGAVIPDDGASLSIGNNTTISWIDSGGLITNTKGGAMIDRRWNVSPTTQPTNPVNVRIFFTNQEYEDLADTLANHNGGASGYTYQITDPTVMSMYKINSNTPYLSPHDTGVTGVIFSHSTTPTTSTWTYDSLEGGHVAEFQVQSFSGGGGGNGGGSGALPVDLIEFEALPFGPHTALLKWTTASEVNNSHFVVERSYDAQNFNAIGEVLGNGTSNELLDYQYIDNTIDANKTIAYYRLRQVDFDGKEELSVKRSIDFEKIRLSDNILVYPNPSKDIVNVSISNDDLRKYNFQILSFNGSVVIANEGITKHGNTASIDLSGLSSGIYTVVVSNHSEIHYVKVTKL